MSSYKDNPAYDPDLNAQEQYYLNSLIDRLESRKYDFIEFLSKNYFYLCSSRLRFGVVTHIYNSDMTVVEVCEKTGKVIINFTCKISMGEFYDLWSIY